MFFFVPVVCSRDVGSQVISSVSAVGLGIVCHSGSHWYVVFCRDGALGQSRCQLQCLWVMASLAAGQFNSARDALLDGLCILGFCTPAVRATSAC